MMLSRFLISLSALAMSALPVAAQTGAAEIDTTPVDAAAPLDMVNAPQTRPIAAPDQEYCISILSSFPSDDHVARYQFFRLTQELAVDAKPGLRAALAHYGGDTVNANTPVLDVIESIANPVLRQAAPDIIIANMNHLITFADRCETYISGQISSLHAFDNTLTLNDYVIREDALFLRQVLSGSLQRVDAHTDPRFADASSAYASSLIVMRDDIEFEGFETDIDDLEMMFMTDLDGRLARSNDIINEEMNRETLGNAVTLASDMNKDLKRKEDQRVLVTLLRILSIY